MHILRDTPMQHARAVWQLRPPRPSLTTVVKATYAIDERGQCVLLPEQPAPRGEVFHDDDARASLRFDTELALFKPRGEWVLSGTAYTPGGRPSTSALVQIRVGASEKAIAVIGDRAWSAGLLGREASPPLPFTAMPLRPERAFGGPSVAGNPCGVGTEPVAGRLPLPNLEQRTDLIQSPSARPAPAFTTPRGAAWPARVALAGTYDERWKKTRWPWFPADFDVAYFNSAPLDQQIDGYWRGDEELVLSGLHPSRTTIRARLPGRRPRIFLLERAPTGRVLREVPARLDTIAIDADALTVTCIWRGVTEVASADLAELEATFVLDDALGAPVELAECERRMHERAEAEGVSLRPAPAEPDDELPSAAPVASRARARVAARVPSRLSSTPIRDAGDAAPRVPSAPRPGHLRDVVLGRLARERSLRGVDLTGADLSELDLREVDLTRAVLTDASLRGACLDAARLGEAVLLRADLRGVSALRASFDGATIDEACFEGARLERASFVGAQGERACFDRARLDRADLSKAELVRASLAGVVAHEARFDRADLSNVSCDGADFAGSHWVEATLAEARGERVVLDRAELTGLRAGGAVLEALSARHASAAGAKLAGARLVGADLDYAVLERADLSEALLFGAKLDAADLRRARFVGAILDGASLVRANAMGAVFERADLSRADLRGASCFEADFLEARLDDARTELADLRRTKLAGSR